MDIRHLRLFLTVCQHKNISSAASELRIAQPAVSKAIRRLESQLGVSLFERMPRGVELTPYGEILLQFAGDMEANYNGALRHIDAVKAAEAGEIVVGAGGSWRDEILPLAVAELCRRRPRARIRINTGTANDLHGQLLRGDIDFLLAPVDLDPGLAVHLKAEILLDNAMVVVCRNGHPALGPDNHSIEQLARLSWAVPFGTIVRERYARLFSAHGITPPIPTVEVQDAACLFDIVENTDLVTYVPDIRLAGRASRFAILPSRDATDRRRSGLLTRQRGVLPPLCHELIAIIRELTPPSGPAAKPRD